MNSIHLDIKHQIYWLSYEYLESNNVSQGTLNSWSTRKICKRKYIDGRAYINYDTIPEPTREKLPTKDAIKAEYNRQKIGYLETWFTDELKTAYKSKNVSVWINTILANEAYKGIARSKVTQFARRAAVFEKAVEIHNEYTAQGVLSALFYAYSSIYPNNYSQKNRFCMALKKAKEEGILSVAINKRTIVKRQPKYTDLYKYWAEYLLSHNKAYSIVDSYDLFAEACMIHKVDTPCYSWFKRYYYTNKTQIDLNRLGKTVYEKQSANYAKIIPALHSGDQWQMDGWRIPIYCKKQNEKGGNEYFVTYNLFAVLDAHSRKIIGWDVSESENTENILKGLENAVSTTGILPYEIVADNHSFNKTKEAGYLKAETDALGVHWTIDSNPRRKAILERAFRTLGDKHFKKMYGYIGQGVKSKIKNGITQQELRDIYTKPSNFLTYNQIIAIVVYVIDEYNNKIKKSLGDTPNARYEKSPQPNSIKVDDFARLTIFNRKSEHKVTHGQITIKRGMYTYEYQLPSEYSVQYNGKDVGVRYADFDEIYLYDLETNEPICSVGQKYDIHGALANQSQTDVNSLQKNSGRIKGNNSKIRKRKETLFDTANTINPNAYETINKITTPKDVIEEVKQNHALRNEVQKRGVNTEIITPLPMVDEMLDSSMKPRKKENKHPFSVKDNEIRIIDIKELARAANSHQ